MTTPNSTAPTPRQLMWNDTAILDAMGRRPDLCQELLKRHAQPIPTEIAIYQWVSRERIPDKWRPKVVYALMKEGKLAVNNLFRLGTKASA